jgi:methylated-DNA-[protein]-cysteine S-methyltransferase
MDIVTATLTWSVLPSPVGDLLLIARSARSAEGDGEEERLTGVFFHPHKGSAASWDRARETGARDDDGPVLGQARRQLEEYFAVRRTEFDLPLGAGGTGFQRKVWAALTEIPYGQTRSYGEIARRLGLPPGASRAVGLANGQNPISIIVPCHRVIGADGSLTGYGGGLDRKRILLDLERGGSLF